MANFFEPNGLACDRLQIWSYAEQHPFYKFAKCRKQKFVRIARRPIPRIRGLVGLRVSYLTMRGSQRFVCFEDVHQESLIFAENDTRREGIQNALYQG